MSLFKWIFLGACAMTLTACPGGNEKKSDKKNVQQYAGVWVRAADYCDFQYWNDEDLDPRCDSIDYTQVRSPLATGSNWQSIFIDLSGGINSYNDYYDAKDDGSWSLGYIAKGGYYVGYLTTMNSNQRPNSITVAMDFNTLDFWIKNRRYSSARVSYFKVTNNQAEDFAYSYKALKGKNGNRQGERHYGKGKRKDRRTPKVIRSEEREKANAPDEDPEYSEQQYDQCIADGGSVDECSAK